MYRVHLGLGSNIAPRHDHLAAAVEKIGLIARVASVSSLYETEPVDMEGAEDFLNMAMEISTDDDPPLLLAKLRAIEKALGRKPSSHRAPRTVDIDILLYRGMSYADHMVTVPHPELHRRRFALEPLNEIAPAALHPTMERTVAWLLRHCRDQHRVTIAGSLPDALIARTV
jgi:2-amino-4-hydroxy-6-hydroxymethyldihydropteridine diphosphokinase